MGVANSVNPDQEQTDLGLHTGNSSIILLFSIFFFHIICDYTIYSIIIYFIPSSEFNAYLKQIKAILSAVKKYRIFSLVTNTIYIFSL